MIQDMKSAVLRYRNVPNAQKSLTLTSKPNRVVSLAQEAMESMVDYSYSIPSNEGVRSKKLAGRCHPISTC